MTTASPDTRHWCPSQWNAWVEAGQSIAECRDRLAQVPEEWRESVRDHMRTVYMLRDAARARAEKSNRWRETP